MGRMSNEEIKRRELASEYVIEMLLGHERYSALLKKDEGLQAFLAVSGAIRGGTESGTMYAIANAIKNVLDE